MEKTMAKASKKAKESIHCEINGQGLEVREGTSIIEAFKTLGQDIAHYCWHPGLSVAGVCRLCMVDIEGRPKLEIACNTEVTEGMKISNQSERVRKAVRWGLEFHLINHPLDCPICDQAGECELQEQYMRFGQYSPNMAERKVRKRKVIDLGPKIVLDSERCILCSRCVRFTDEVSRTGELGIFHRGDRSEIGVFKDKPLNNNYAFNTVDICPVGALTSKDFRFQQRVWYLKTAKSICSGCSTGCNIEVDHNEEGIFRVRPRYNEDVNGHWICDEGRMMYALSNTKGRLLKALPPESFKALKSEGSKTNGSSDSVSLFLGGGRKKPGFDINQWDHTVSVLKKIRSLIGEDLKDQNKKQALVLTGQYSTEEYESLIGFFLNSQGTKKDIYYWQNNLKSFEDFDGLLLRGDKNPNTKGLFGVLEKKTALNPWEELKSRLEKGDIKILWVAGPENQKVYPDMEQKIQLFESAGEHIIWWTAHPLPVSSLKKTWQIPAKAFFEKGGTFSNFKGLNQKTEALGCFVSSALSLSESAQVLGGEDLKPPSLPFLTESGAGSAEEPVAQPMKSNHFTLKKRAL